MLSLNLTKAIGAGNATSIVPKNDMMKGVKTMLYKGKKLCEI